jgi:basic membrane protein A and related proteins
MIVEHAFQGVPSGPGRHRPEGGSYMSRGQCKHGFLIASVAAGLIVSACGGSSSSSGTSSNSAASSGGKASQVRVGYISVAPVTSGDWETANWHGMQAAASKYGLKVSNQESVGYDQAASVLSRMAPDEDVIIADSSGYEAPVLQVAPKFPKTKFIVMSDLSTTKGLKNVSGWAINWNELGYLAGTAACLAAKKDGKAAVGHVNSEPIPAFTRFAGGDQDGAKASGCSLSVTWINSFEDAAKAKQAALTMLSKGAGAITTSADTADQGSQAAAKSKKAAFIADYVPNSGALTSVLVDFDGAYAQVGKLLAGKQLQPKIYPISVENGLMSYSKPFAGSASGVASQAMAIERKMKSGALKVDAAHQIKP